MDPCSSKEKSGNSVDPKFIRQGKFARSAKYFFCALSLANFKFLVFCTHVQIMVQHSTYNLYRTINSCLVKIILNLNVTCPTRTTKQIIGNDVNKSWKAQNLWYLRIKKIIAIKSSLFYLAESNLISLERISFDFYSYPYQRHRRKRVVANISTTWFQRVTTECTILNIEYINLFE